MNKSVFLRFLVYLLLSFHIFYLKLFSNYAPKSFLRPPHFVPPIRHVRGVQCLTISGIDISSVANRILWQALIWNTPLACPKIKFAALCTVTIAFSCNCFYSWFWTSSRITDMSACISAMVRPPLVLHRESHWGRQIGLYLESGPNCSLFFSCTTATFRSVLTSKINNFPDFSLFSQIFSQICPFLNFGKSGAPMHLWHKLCRVNL